MGFELIERGAVPLFPAKITIQGVDIMTVASAIFGSVVAICIASVICKFLDEWFLWNDKK